MRTGSHALTQWWVETAAVLLVIIAALTGAWLILAVAVVMAGALAYFGVFQRQRVKRAWTRAVIDSGAADPPPKRSRRQYSYTGPRATRVRPVAAGDLLTVRVGRGNTVRDLEDRADEIAVCLSRRFAPVSEVRITPDRQHANRATALIVRRDPFEQAGPVPWQWLDAETVSLWDPVPFGIDEQGQPVGLDLVYRNVLIGGQPDSGKSVALQTLVAAGALDPNTRLWLLDGKGEVELAAWEPCAQALVGSNGKDAINVLQTVAAIVDKRYADLKGKGRKIRPGDGLPLHMLVIDEIATYTADMPDQKDREEINRLLTSILAKCRAAGVIVVAATQKPHGEIMPTNARDLFSTRLALSCNTPQATDTILGQGWAAQGYRAERIPLDTPGVGYLRARGNPVKIRVPYLTDDNLADIASRAIGNRVQDEADALLPHTPTTPKAKAADLRFDSNRRALLEALPTTGAGMTRGDIVQAVGRPDRELDPVRKALISDGLVEKLGGGVSGDPFRYRRVRTGRAQHVRSPGAVPDTGKESA